MYERGVERRFEASFYTYVLLDFRKRSNNNGYRETIHISTNRRKNNETCNRLCTPKYRKLQPCDFRNGKSELEEKGHEVRVRDLYELNFNPVLGASDFISFSQGNTPADIKEEQEHISWADSITFIYPVWWAGLPAILKDTLTVYLATASLMLTVKMASRSY